MRQPRPGTAAKIPLVIRYAVLAIFVVGALFPCTGCSCHRSNPTPTCSSCRRCGRSRLIGQLPPDPGHDQQLRRGTDFVRYAVNST